MQAKTVLNYTVVQMKAGIANLEKTSFARQGHSKHISMVTNNHMTTDESEVVFSMQPVPRLYKENHLDFLVS